MPHPRNSGSGVGVRGRLGPIKDQVIDGDIGADWAQDAAPPRLARVGIGHGGERQRHVPDRIDLHPRGCQPALLTSSFRNARWLGPLPFRFGCSAFRSAIRRARSPEKLSGRDLATSDPSSDGFGGDRIPQSTVVDIDAMNPRATLIADLQLAGSLPPDCYACSHPRNGCAGADLDGVATTLGEIDPKGRRGVITDSVRSTAAAPRREDPGHVRRESGVADVVMGG